MQTIDASAVAPEELEQLADVASRFPEGSELRTAVQNVTASVRSGSDVIYANPSDAVSPAVAARILGVSRTHLYKILDSGDLAFTAVGRDRRITLADLKQYCDAQANGQLSVAERFAHPTRTRAAALRAYKARTR